MKNYSAKFKETVHATGAPEAPRVLLEISHPALSEPARLVEDTDDFPYGAGYGFVAGAAYALNQVVVPQTYNGRYYVCTVAGTAGTEPAWPTTIGQTVASGAATFRCEGNQFKACAFDITLPDDVEQQLPRAELAIDNVGRELMQWLEASEGGRGAQVRLMQALRSEPGVIEWEVTLDLTHVRATPARIAGELGFEDLLSMPAVGLTYRPEVAPGLF